ncbi:MAG: hypothetical protein HY231_09395 [Acidobacteria bacterium]|nr:hypothetical protein [Acidobacteriota bacterium]
MNNSLRARFASLATPVEQRLFREYGAIFVTRAVPPPTILFADAAHVEAFQARLQIGSANLAEYAVELQAEALTALLSAVEAAAGKGLRLTPRAADAARRSYEQTVQLWSRNVQRGLEHWQNLGRLEGERAAWIRALAPVEQVALILALEEDEQIYFGTFFNRSILYSVAAPGASQHLSLLALDVAQYRDEAIETILNERGWHRTVVNDLPHFTYLGYAANQLPQLGLKALHQVDAAQTFRYWLPEVE